MSWRRNTGITRATVIIFNNTMTKVLAGKESKWATNTKIMPQKDVDTLIALFKDTDSRSTDIYQDREYYKGQIAKIPSSIIAQIDKRSEDHPPRITFGDIKYNELANGTRISETRPVYLPRSAPLSFPGGGKDDKETLRDAALRELKEETQIDLSLVPFDSTRLIDTGYNDETYQIFYYIALPEEESEIERLIALKNQDAYSELHELQMTDVKNIIFQKAYRQLTVATQAATPSAAAPLATPAPTTVKKTYVPPHLRGGNRLGHRQQTKRPQAGKKSRSSKQRWRRMATRRQHSD